MGPNTILCLLNCNIDEPDFSGLSLNDLSILYRRFFGFIYLFPPSLCVEAVFLYLVSMVQPLATVTVDALRTREAGAA